MGNVALPVLPKLTLLCAQAGQVHSSLAPHAGVELRQRRDFPDKVRGPKRLEDVVGYLPNLGREGGQGTCPVLTMHGGRHLTGEQEECCLQGLQRPLPVHARLAQGGARAARAVPPWAGIAQVFRTFLHTCRGQHIEVGTSANKARSTRQGALHGAPVRVLGALCLLPTHEGIGKAALGGQGWDAALALLAVLHAAAMRRFPELLLRVALKLDPVCHAHGPASTDPVPGQLQGLCCGIAHIALRGNLFNLRVVGRAAELKVGSVTILSHGPGSPLLVRNDHAPFVGLASVSVKVAVHNRGNGAFPIVALHLDEVALLGKAHLVSISIGHVHGGFAAGRCEGVRIPHVSSRAVVLLSAAPNGALCSIVAAERASAQGLACFEALLCSSGAHSWGGQGPVLAG